MREQLEARRAELQAELEQGQKLQMTLQQQLTTLEQTLLRISGAIQVLGEFLTQPGAPAPEEVDDGDNS